MKLNQRLNNSKTKATKIPFWVVVFWIAIWQIGSMIIDQSILLASPVDTIKSLYELSLLPNFWFSILLSLLRILTGFFVAILCGFIFALISHKVLFFRQLLTPIIVLSKSVPVASFVILILIWFSTSALSSIIAFLMAFPIVYTNILTAMGSLDQKLLEMTKVFDFKPYATFRYVIIPQLIPYFHSACLLSLGMCFKAGIAAEVIGLPNNSIGEGLYESKIYLDTPNLFAWTLTIIILSFLCEKLCQSLIGKLATSLERVVISND